MKTILHARYAILFVFISLCNSNSLLSQCNNCTAGSENQTITSCDGDYDLTAVTPTDGGVEFHFFATCSSGTLSDTIDMPISYSAASGTVVYARELDGGGSCLEIIQLTLNEVNLSVSIVEPSATFCTPTYTLTANPMGGDGSETLLWSPNNETSTSINANASGTYSVTVSQDGCSATSDDVVLVKSNLMVSIDPAGGDFCSGSSLTLNAIVTGEDGSFTGSWSTPSGTESGLSVNADEDGMYTVTITDQSCSATSSSVMVIDESITAMTSETEVSCFGGDDGTITVNPSGGVTYRFSLNGAAQVGPAATWTFTGLTAGTYDIEVEDVGGNMCTIVVSETVTQPASGFSINPVGSDPNMIDGTDGSIALNPMNGNSPYTWNYTRSMPAGPAGGPSSGSTINGLSEGTYAITVTDDDGCSDTGTAVLTDPDCTMSISNLTDIDPPCHDDDGSITITWANNDGNVDVSWSSTGGGSGNSGSADNQGGSSYTIMNVNTNGNATSEFTVTIEDNVGCEKSQMITLTNPAELSISASQGSASCVGASTGSIVVTKTNGSENYTVSWDGPSGNDGSTPNLDNDDFPYTITGLPSGSYDITIMDMNGCVANDDNVTVGSQAEVSVDIVGDLTLCSDQTSGTLTTSPTSFSNWVWTPSGGGVTKNITNPGTYSVVVTDAAGCTGSSSVTVVREDPIEISLNSGSSTLFVSCTGVCDGVINMNVTGGTGGFTYSWTGSSSTSQDLTGLCPGFYTLMVTDASGCTAVSQAIEIEDQDPLSVFPNPSPASCFGFSDGSISLNVQGGTPEYTYAWSGPAGFTSTSGNLTGILTAGPYTVTVTDDNGCSNTAMATVNEPDPVPAEVLQGNVSICLNDSADLTASGGGTYSWNNGEGTSPNISVSPTSSTTYTVTVTDGSGCTASASSIVTVNPLPNPMIDVSESSGLVDDDGIICEDGVVTLTATGASSLIWDGGKANPITESPNNDITYEVLATDGNGCTATASRGITVNQNPNASINNQASGIDGDVQNLLNNSTTNCGGSSFLSCQWEIDGTNLSTDCGNIAPVITGEGEKLISLTVTNECGCSDAATTIIDIADADDCQVSEFSVNNGAPFACVDVPVPYVQNNVTSNGNTCPYLTNTTLSIFKNGIDVTTITGIVEVTGSTIRFREVGEYVVQNFFEDQCGCSRDPERIITIVPAPVASFAANNPTQVCAGESYTINIDGSETYESVKISGVTGPGSEDDYTDNSFILTPNTPGIQELTIISADNGICEDDIDGELLNIEVLEAFSVTSVDGQNGCNEAGDQYDLTILTEGGDLSKSITLLEGGFTTKSLGASGLIVEGLNPLLTYEFTVMRGDVCDPEPIVVEQVTCFCGINMPPRPDADFAGCENEVFTIEGLYDPEADDGEFDPLEDTMIYIIHNTGAIGASGTVWDVISKDQKAIEPNFNNFTFNVEYYLSPVGIKKSVLERFDFSDPVSLSNSDEDDCFSVVQGMRMIWYKNPAPEIKTQNNESEVCKNQYDFMVYIDNVADGSEVSITVDGLPQENIRQFGSQDTAFIYFEHSNQDSFVIRANVIGKNFDAVKNENIDCVTEITRTVYVKAGEGAPPLSDIVLWPGNILASTADSTNCFDWGFYLQGTEVTGLGDEKYFYAATDIDFENTSRIYFVDIFNCLDPSCSTRVFFNLDGPPPGVNLIDLENFSYQVAPNPNQGQFNLILNAHKASEIKVDIFGLTGQRVFGKVETFRKGETDYFIDLSGYAKGIYFMRIIDEENNQFRTEKIVIN